MLKPIYNIEEHHIIVGHTQKFEQQQKYQATNFHVFFYPLPTARLTVHKK